MYPSRRCWCVIMLRVYYLCAGVGVCPVSRPTSLQWWIFRCGDNISSGPLHWAGQPGLPSPTQHTGNFTLSTVSWPTLDWSLVHWIVFLVPGATIASYFLYVMERYIQLRYKVIFTNPFPCFHGWLSWLLSWLRNHILSTTVPWRPATFITINTGQWADILCYNECRVRILFWESWLWSG